MNSNRSCLRFIELETKELNIFYVGFCILSAKAKKKKTIVKSSHHKQADE